MKKIAAILLLLIYLLLAVLYSNKVPPKGDEIHFLLMSQSLLKDKDVYMENNYSQKDYQSYTNINLDEHAVVGRNGHEYSFHDLGLPFVTLPFYAVLGRTGVSLFMAFVSFLLIIFTYKFCLKVTKSEKYSLMTALIFSLSTPVLFYSHLIFTEIMAALIIVSFFVSPNFSILLLPWLNIRYLLVLIFLMFLIIIRKYKPALLLYASMASVIFYFLFNYYCFGTFNLSYRYLIGNLPTGAGNIFANIINVLMDRQYGLFVYAPLYLLAVPGYFLWRIKKKPDYYSVITLSLIYILPILNFRDWHGGYNPPPARYLIPLLPLWIPAIALTIKRFKRKTYIFLLAFLTYGVALYFRGINSYPNHGFIYQDGIAQLIIEIQDFLPNYFPNRSYGLFHFAYLLGFLVYIRIFSNLLKTVK